MAPFLLGILQLAALSPITLQAAPFVDFGLKS